MAPSRIETSSPITISSTKGESLAKSASRYGDFRDDFFRDGYVVIKGGVPKDRAAAYQNEALNWLESFNIGFDKNDKTTWKRNIFRRAGEAECICILRRRMRNMSGMRGGKLICCGVQTSKSHGLMWTSRQ